MLGNKAVSESLEILAQRRLFIGMLAGR